MPAVSLPTQTPEAGSRCNPWIFRSLRTRGDAARGQPGAGHEPKLLHRKTLPKSSVAPLAANPRPGLMRGKQRPMRRARKDAIAFVAGIVDPGGGPMRRLRKDAVAVVAGIVDPGWSRACFACQHHRCRLQQWRLDPAR